MAKKSLILLALLVGSLTLGAQVLYSDSFEKKEVRKTFMKPKKEDLQKKLTPLQFKVTQEDGTEAPFQNQYWDHKEPGIYVDIVSGEPLFSSIDKYDSGSGWPSFTKPLEGGNLVEREDGKFFMKRMEIRSKNADSHLGHVFSDGPAPTGLRYCINSAALRFIPVADLEKEGYGEYKRLFSKTQDKSQKIDLKDTKRATLAGGCFWGVEELFRQLPGVIETEVGYTGGDFPNPTYQDVKKGTTGHAESIQITYNPKEISFEELLLYFFKIHDPTTENRQGNDVGSQYRSAIFYHDDEQKKVADNVMRRVQNSGSWKRPLVTKLVPAKEFFSAEEYHQDYLQKNPNGYTCHFEREIQF